jgi:hypothetical protein
MGVDYFLIIFCADAKKSTPVGETQQDCEGEVWDGEYEYPSKRQIVGVLRYWVISSLETTSCSSFHQISGRIAVSRNNNRQMWSVILNNNDDNYLSQLVDYYFV